MNLKLEPFFVEKPWGGNYISENFKLPQPLLIGEVFLLSTLKNQENKVEGKLLSEVLNLKLPYLVKLIDANDNLSVQVHPNDDFAQKLENSTGKTECWLITDVNVGAGIYYGLKPGVTLKDFFQELKRDGDILNKLNFIPVKKNDFIIVPAGTIHAIGAGVRLIEFQQSSGITYRIWDWGRIDRELHIKKAELVCNEDQTSCKPLQFDALENESVCLDHSDFRVTKIDSMHIKCSSPHLPYSYVLNLKDLSYHFKKQN